MLGEKAIADAVSRGDISISYEYDLTADPPVRLPDAAIVDPYSPDTVATRIFDRHFFGDRLGLTLGPVVVSDSIRRLPGRVLFKQRAGHFDLTRSNGEIEIMPGESFGVHSVEYIRVGPKVGAYILPRLTLATVGLVVVPTYIDPYWEGILQLYITNLSPRPHSLKFGERIAICRFYEIEGATENPEIKSQFAQKSHHYGLNWRRILDSDFDVQPRRKHHVPAALYRERLRIKAAQFVSNWHNVAGLAAGAALIAAVFAYAKFDSKAGQIDAISAQVETLKTEAERGAATQKALEAGLPQSGSIDVQLAPGQQQFVQDVTLERRPAPGAEVLVFPVPGREPITASGKVYCGSGAAADCTLRITVQRTSVSPRAVDTQIKWLIVGR